MSNDLREIKIFISYANEDLNFLNEIKRYALGFNNIQRTVIWDDGKIRPGQEWDNEIKRHLTEADIILLLISPDFLLSEYINRTEIKTAFERHEKKECSIVPVFIRYCELDEYPQLSALQGFPKGKNFAELKEEKDRSYGELSRAIKNMISEIRTKAGMEMASPENKEQAENIAQHENELAKINLIHSRSSFSNTIKDYFLSEVEREKKYKQWKFDVKNCHYVDRIVDEPNDKVKYLLYIITSEEDIEETKRHLAEKEKVINTACGQYTRIVLWVGETTLEEKLPTALKSNKIVVGTMPAKAIEIIYLLEKERLEFLKNQKDKYSQQFNVYLLYDFEKDHNNTVRIELKEELENRAELLPFYSPPSFSAVEIQQQLKHTKGAILFYGTAETNWYCYWQSEIQKIYSLSQRAVCLSDPEKIVKIKRDVSRKAFMVMEDERMLREYVNQFVENLKMQA